MEALSKMFSRPIFIMDGIMRITQNTFHLGLYRLLSYLQCINFLLRHLVHFHIPDLVSAYFPSLFLYFVFPPLSFLPLIPNQSLPGLKAFWTFISKGRLQFPFLCTLSYPCIYSIPILFSLSTQKLLFVLKCMTSSP